jgi:dienelactone hydrolase
MFAAWICSALVSATALAKDPLVLNGRPSADTRLGPLRGERGDFLFRPPASPQEWESRADQVRRIMRVTMGLWPLPTRTPLNAVIHGRIEQDDYTIDKVYFESVPEFFVTGNLYRPKGKSGRLPAVLSPHGHFPGGRFIDEGLKAVRKKIEADAEQHEDGGRSFMQSRCVLLARMGCVVFHYDMIGYGDCEQIPLDVAHKFSGSRAEMKEPPENGLYSASALLNGQNSLGLHTWNSIRALDFLESLPDVDPKRIAVTGGSGGGTQTFMLCAVDDRPLVSVPVVIVSADRQGGCVCENICGFRIGTTNLEFNALHAPKPLLLISADDASRTMPERGFPEMKQHYKMLGAEGNVELEALLQFPHNYNAVSRQAMAHFVNRHLKLGLAEPIVERPFKRLTKEDLTVWNEEHPRPKGGPGFERQLLDTLAIETRKQIEKLTPHDKPSLKTYRQIVGGGWDVVLRRPPETSLNQKETSRDVTPEGIRFGRGLIPYRTVGGHQAELPSVELYALTPNGKAVLWLTAAGKGGLFNENGTVKPPVRRLLDGGYSVVGVDLIGQGEHVGDGATVDAKRQRSLPGEEAFGGWTYCYNVPLFAQRVHDVLTVVARAGGSDIDVIGIGEMGPVAAAAVSQAQGRVIRAAIETRGFRFGNVTDIYDSMFLPGAVRYGDLPGLLSLAAPTKLWIASEGKVLPGILHATYQAAGVPENLTPFIGKDVESAAVTWILETGTDDAEH